MKASSVKGFIAAVWLRLVSASLAKAAALVSTAATGLLGMPASLSLFLQRRRVAQRRLLAALLGVIGVTAPAAAQPFAAGPPGVALSDARVLSVALPITNTSMAATSNVTVTVAQLGGLPLLSPILPVSLGNLAAGAAATLTVDFDSSCVPACSVGPLVVQGTFVVNAVPASFTLQSNVSVPLASTQSHSVSVPPNTPIGAPYQPSLPPWPTEPNEPTLPTTPTGPSRPMPVPPPTNIENLGNIGAVGQTTIPFSLTSPLQLYVNKEFGTSINASGWPLDPNVATKGKVVLVTHNTFLEYSTDGGITFLELDPTTIFPNFQNGTLIDGGLCCDQAVVYVPSIDRFVWLMQFWPGKTTKQNRNRLAAARPADLLKAGCVGAGCTFVEKTFADAWTYWDLTSNTFGLGAHSMDYPDLSTGKNSLYMSTDPGGGALTVRIPLSQIAASTTINMDYLNYATNAYPSRVTRNTGTEAYWAIHNNTSQMKIFSWTEGSNLIYSRDVNVASWYNSVTTPYTSLTPDGQNWVHFLQGHVPADSPVGATVAGNNLWFAWTAPGAPGIPYTHIRLAHLNRTNFSVIKNDAIWNSNYAYAYGFLNTNANGEVGMSYGWGGVTQYVNSAVAFLTGTRHFWGTAVGNTGTGRYGDFLGIRVDSQDTKCFVTAGMAVKSTGGGTNYGDLVYSEFGRQGDCTAGQ